MERKEKRNEVVLLLLAVLPVVYLLISWNALPDPVPVHYSVNMVPNGYQSKISLLLCLVLFNAAFYVLFKYIHRIDPKKKINPQSRIYTILRFATGVLLSFLGMLMLVMAQDQTLVLAGNKLIVLFVGVLFIVLGNYLPVVKQNYFIGIRTPWTLDNESVWTKTHRVGGKLFFIGGLLIAGAAFFPDPEISFWIVMSVTIGVAVFSILYSFLIFRREKRGHA
ncbi:MAG: hypothetical protein K0S33_2615 [Bacteroidetes bacterium]|jgi:uncharacterized membrane protein|nr:hypothetical protein [Bacteroidota bacterium]